MILVSAHYDSYFSGFQDDNAAVALMLGIARALGRKRNQTASYRRFLCDGCRGVGRF